MPTGSAEQALAVAQSKEKIQGYGCLPVLEFYGIDLDGLYEDAQVEQDSTSDVTLRYQEGHTTGTVLIGVSERGTQDNVPSPTVQSCDYQTYIEFNSEGVTFYREIALYFRSINTNYTGYGLAGFVRRMLAQRRGEPLYLEREQIVQGGIELILSKLDMDHYDPNNAPRVGSFSRGLTCLKLGDLELFPQMNTDPSKLDMRGSNFDTTVGRNGASQPAKSRTWIREKGDEKTLPFCAEDDIQLTSEPTPIQKLSKELQDRYPLLKRIIEGIFPLISISETYDRKQPLIGQGQIWHHLACREINWKETAKATADFIISGPQKGNYGKTGFDLEQMLVFEPIED